MIDQMNPQNVDLERRPQPPVDPAKVARVRRALAQGRYALDPDAIAAAMIATDLALPLTD